MIGEAEFMGAFDAWTDAFVEFVGAEGKVPPGQHRAAGYNPPKHRWAETKLAWRAMRMRVGLPPAGSSPAAQQALGLNRDVTLTPGKSEATRNPE